ncbi:MAG: peptide deformylase [Alphaproteobacteria bacterium]|nr:peptide deformylase [Alphaproteobacteria bacterium]
MTLYTILVNPESALKTVSHPVDQVDKIVQAQMQNMLETMYEAPGIGLAANQINILNRVLVMDLADVSGGENKTPICMANPEIIFESEERSVWEEGCLSLPENFAEVERPAIVRVKYLDETNTMQEGKFEGLASHCVQHEIDHLDGIVFTDHLSRLRKNIILRKVAKIKKDMDIL